MAKAARWGIGAALSGLLLGLSGAQGSVSMYGGTFQSGKAVSVEVYAPRGTAFRLERVLDPARLLAQARDPHRPQVPAGLPTQLVKTVRSSGGAVNLGRLPSGVYLLRQGQLSAVVLVSRLGLITKRDTNTALVYTADQQTGAVRPAQVWALGTNQSARTAGGVAKFGGKLGKEQVFLARSGDDWAISDSRWNSYSVTKWVGYVYPDRPIYRPGQHVELKGVVRLPGSLRPLAGAPVRLRVLNSDGDEILNKKLTTSAYGAVSAGLDLGLGAGVGQYRAEIIPAGDSVEDDNLPGGSFEVQEYQKPEYEVKVVPSRISAVQGEKVSVSVSAKYLFGGAVSGAKVTYNVTRARYYSPGFDTDSLAPGDEGPDYGSDLVVQGTGRLDAAGNLNLSVSLARDEDGWPMSYRIEAEVEDESRRTVSAQTRVIAYPAAVNVQVSTSGYIYDAGKAIPVSLDTRDLMGAGRAAPVTLELVRYRWVYEKGEWQEKETRLSRQEVTTGATGLLQTRLTAPRGGGYAIRATVKDAQGRLSTNENFVWVIAAGEDWDWFSRDISVRLDKKSYAVGDTVTALVGNPKPGAPVLLTLEGDRIRSHTVLQGQGAVLTYRFKVTPDMSPNIFVGAAALGDGQWYSSEVKVKVPRPDAALSVTIQPSQPRFAPGEKGRFTVSVKNAQGQGVGSELSFGVVDQAIYLVQRDNAPTMLQVFGAERDNLVGTESSTDFYFSAVGNSNAERPRAPMTEAAFAQNKSEADKAAQGEITPRENFKDTLLWIPHLVTDAQGQATVEVTFPDNLTTWIATARAQTVQPRFGQATASALVTKDVIARLSLPPFLVRGDQATLAGLVNNTLPTPLGGTATAQLSGLTPLGGAALSAKGAPLTLTAGGRSRQDMQVRATAVGQASVTFTARTPLGSDALKLPLSVKARGYEEKRHVVGNDKHPSVSFTLPAATNPQTVRVSLSAAPSLLSAVAPALEYLIGYPYGCTEQTMSRFLPALLARQALGQANLPDEVRQNLPEILESSLARLQKFQHEDGGWNFWENDDSTLEMTAYVVEGLLRAKQAGAKVDNAMLDRGLKYLSKAVKDAQARSAERARAYQVLAKAGRTDQAQLLAFAQKTNLAPYALAQTTLALKQAGQTQAALQTLARLKNRQLKGNGLIHWDSPRRGDWYDYWDDNSVQVTAAALEALATLEPDSPLIPGVSQWLLMQRRGPKWLGTQDTTSVIVAALQLPRAATSDATLQVQLDGKSVGELQVGEQASTLEFAPNLGAGKHTLSVSGAPTGLTFAAEVKSAREPDTLGGLGSAFDLNRKYERLEARWDAKEEQYTYTRTPLLKNGKLQPVKVGDLLLVTVSVKPRNQQQLASYLLVSDPIPAGMKALDERSLAIAGLKQSDDEYNWESWNYWYSGRDLRDDRVDLYAYWLDGQQSMTYLLRAQTPGTFTALPTHAFLMYNDSVESYGPAATLTVKDK